MGDKQGGMNDLAAAIELDPKCSEAYYNRGIVNEFNGQQAGGSCRLLKGNRIKTKV